MKYTIICALVAAAAAAGARGNTYFAPNAGPECFMHNKRTVVHFTTKFHPSFTCSHNAALTKCSCVSLHPTHHHGKCQEIFHTDGSQHTLGGDCSASGKNPEYTQWSAWSTCTKTCGGGSTTRTRTCNHATSVCQAAGLGDATQTQSCKTQGCPVHCALSAWSSFGACSANCGGGTQTRTKSVVTQPANGGNTCGNKSESRSCNTQSCGKQDCQSWRDAGKTASGTYHLCPTAGVCFDAYCRMEAHKGWTLILARGDCGSGKCPHVKSSRLTPGAGTGEALSSVNWGALKGVSTHFMFTTTGGSCGAQTGYGSLSTLSSGQNCANLDNDLTRCNLVHNERSGCGYRGGDYNGLFGVSTAAGRGYTNRCNYFSNNYGYKKNWSSGASCAAGGYYATTADMYVTRPGTTLPPPASCQEHRNQGKTASGTYTICPDGTCFSAYCKMSGSYGWTLILARGDCGSGKCPHVKSSRLTPGAGTGEALSSVNWGALKGVSTHFMFTTTGGSCGAQTGYGSLSTLSSGQNCANLDNDLTRCNLVHNERSGCGYRGGDYNGLFGVSTAAGRGYTNRCNYFSNNYGYKKNWSSGASCAAGGYYATTADMWVR